jgi:hypothetical protein
MIGGKKIKIKKEKKIWVESSRQPIMLAHLFL